MLIISHQANLSGAPRALLNIFPYLKSTFDIYVILNNDGKAAKEFNTLGKTFLFYGDKKRKIKSALYLSGIYSFLKRIWFKRILKNLDPELIYINTMAKNIPSAIALLSNKPTIINFHETDFTIAYYPDKQWVQTITNSNAHFIGCAVYVSNFLKESCGIPANRISTIYETIDVNALRSKPLTGKFRTIHNIPDDVKLIGCSGAPQFRKGTDIFIKAAIITLQKEINYYFVWLGGSNSVTSVDSYSKSCMKMISDNNAEKYIHLIPEILNPEEFYSTIDLFIIPSREDPFPLSMLEAMAFEKPVVGFYTSGIPEALTNNNGVLVEGLNSEKLSDSIISILKDEVNYKNIQKNAYKRVSEEYNSPVIAPQLERLILKLMQVEII